MLNPLLQMLLVIVAGWVNRQQLAVIEYLREENRVLRELHGKRRLRFTNDQRRRLAGKGKAPWLTRDLAQIRCRRRVPSPH